jgi:hypothetical protein
MLDHPTAGHCLRNYALLTDGSDAATALGLSDEERFLSRYYWLARFAREWKAVAGYDAGLEQQLFQFLGWAEHAGIAIDALHEVEAAVERDARTGPSK